MKKTCASSRSFSANAQPARTVGRGLRHGAAGIAIAHGTRMLAPSCSCVDPHHEVASCHHAAVNRARAALYRGLFDDADPEARFVAGVRLLNPTYRGPDAAARRFALLDVDD